MQKLIDAQFFCYPKNKDLCILYSDKEHLKSRLFKALSLQISPKEGFLLRFRKTNFGHYLGKLNRKDILKIKLPENKNLKIGYKNNNKIIFFEFDKNDNPINILKKNESEVFEESKFLGYSIIESYTKKEYFKKRNFIKQALEKRRQETSESKILHGDFTHFNVLLSQENNIYFIDDKKVENSVLFDHFYFYSYYIQCLERCQTISNDEVLEIKTDLQIVIKNDLKLEDTKQFLNQINIDDAIGLIPSERKHKLTEFSNFLLKDER